MANNMPMSGFIGEYAHNIDKKGRIVIPSCFRDAYEGRLIVAKGLDGCLSLYTLEQWTTLLEKVSSLPSTKKEVRVYKRKLASKACHCEIDTMGRILIPSNLVKEADLIKECMIIGNVSTVEIWAKEKWDAYDESHADDFEEVAEELTEFLL